MKRCCFIVPYFGKLPNYIQLFLNCCERNMDFEWIFFTDDRTQYRYPSNVHLHYMTFEALHNLVQSKFEFNIWLKNPYKLCDFKPAYGYIFEEYIREYAFWGHCDLDIIFGDLSKFITDDLLERYSKLFVLGHMILYKNTKDINRVFMTAIDNKLLYKESFTSPNITIFDEPYNNHTNVNMIFKALDIPVLEEDLSVNIKVLPTRFVRTRFDAHKEIFVDDETRALHIWQEGHLYRMYIKEGELHKEEAMYIHLQERVMKIQIDQGSSQYKIIPNSFLPIEIIPEDIKSFKKVKKTAFNTHYIQFHKKWKIRKLERIMNRLLGKEEIGCR